jgi:tetratricopeptide (TPR) repeat protein
MNGLALGLAACLAPLLAAAQTPPLEGKAAYDSGRFDAAVSAFSAEVARRPADSDARYNLGAALFKAGRLGPAIVSFERAFSLDPRDSDIRFNLAFALRRAGEDFTPPGIPPALFWAFTALSERELAGLHWLAAWTTLLLGAWGIYAGTRRPAGLGAWTSAAAACWLAFGAWWACLRSVLPPDRAVIVSARAELRHGPGQNFGAAFTVPEGRRVRVLGSSGAWLDVGVLKEGSRGWIEASSVERL